MRMRFNQISQIFIAHQSFKNRLPPSPSPNGGLMMMTKLTSMESARGLVGERLTGAMLV